jgi:hypothetical protein
LGLFSSSSLYGYGSLPVCSWWWNFYSTSLVMIVVI